MIYSGTWFSGVFCLKITTNSKIIIRMADNFLDFPRARGSNTGLLTVTHHIHVIKKLKYTRLGIPSLLVKAIDAGATLLSLATGKAFAAVHFKSGRVDTVVEGIEKIKLEHLTDFLFFQSLRQIALRQGLSALHASVVQKQDRVFLITGPQNAGKSTVAASLMRQGYKILADDDCFFSIFMILLKLYPFPTKMGFKEGGVGRFLEFQPFLVKGFVYGQKKRFSLQHLYVKPKSSYQQPVILFPKHAKLKRLTVNALTKEEILERMIRGNLPQGWRKQMPGIYFESFLAFRSLVNMSHGYELLYDDRVLDEFSNIKDSQW